MVTVSFAPVLLKTSLVSGPVSSSSVLLSAAGGDGAEWTIVEDNLHSGSNIEYNLYRVLPQGTANFLFDANATSLTALSLAVLGNNQPVMAWETSQGNVFYSAYSGNAQGPTVLVASPGLYQADNFGLQALNNGGFVVGYEAGYTTSATKLALAFYNPDASLVTTQTFTTNGAVDGAYMAALKGGGVVEVYSDTSYYADKLFAPVVAHQLLEYRIYSNQGVLVTSGQAAVRSGTANYLPSVIGLNDGGFAVSFDVVADTSNHHASTVETFNSDGSVRGSVVLTNVESTSAFADKLYLAANGDVVVAPPSTVGSLGNLVTPNGVQDNTLAGSVYSQLQTQADGSDLSVSITTPSGVQGGQLALTFKDYTYQRTWTGDAGNNTFIGDGLPSIASGGDGNDTLYSGSAGDKLSGGNGDDLLVSGPGDDVLDGGDGVNDTASYANAKAGVVVSLAVNSQQDTVGAGKDTLSNIENLTGSAFNDTLTGNDGANILSGGDGNDTLTGGLGNDIIDGGSGTDTAVFGSSVSSSVVLLSGSTVTVGGSDGTDTVTNVEILQFADGVIYTGNIAAADILYETYFARDATAYELSYWTARGDQSTAVAQLRQAIVTTDAGKAHLPLTVTSFYETYIGRDPSTSELQYWVDALGSGQISFLSAQSTFEGSQGAAAHEAAEVSSLYQTYFGRAAASAEISYWQGQLASGADTGEELRATLLENPAGAAHTTATLTGLYDTYFGRDPSANELSYWSNQVLGGVTFDGVRTALVTNPYGEQHTDATVAALYQSYLGRAPSSSEASYWQGAVQAGSSFDFLADALATQGTGPQITKLSGTSNADSFTFTATSKHFYIDSFDTAHDTIKLSGMASFDPLAHATDVVGSDGQHDVLITYDTNDTILLHHVTLASLSAADFIHV